MICAMVLAAGRSRRMGTQKLLLPWGNTSVIGHIIDELSASQLTDIVVVTGHYKDEVERALSGRTMSFVHNDRYRQGMLSSVRCGLTVLPQACSAVLVVLGDQPRLAHVLIDKMVAAFAETDKRILVPTYQGKRGHPLLLSTDFISEIRTDFDDTGLRGLLYRHPEEVLEWPSPDADILLDMDFPEDYQRQINQADLSNPPKDIPGEL